MKPLTAKQDMFCREYLIDLNATQAAIRAGYNRNSANRTASENLSKPDISKRIMELQQIRAEKVDADALYVLNRLIDIDKMDVADILNDQGGVKPITEWPLCWRQTLSGLDVSEIWGAGDDDGDPKAVIGLMKKIKWPDKLKNIELLGKHIKVGAFKEVVDHTHSGEVTQITRRMVDMPAPKKSKAAR
jgi:phage terminase small subunit